MATQIRNGRAEGLGTFTGLAIRYEGQWEKGYRHGVGFMIYERREVRNLAYTDRMVG